MKRTIIALCLLLPLAAPAQTSVEAVERSARARFYDADFQGGDITVSGCLADMASWKAKGEEDAAAHKKGERMTGGSKHNLPSFWFNRLSTEELIRLSAEAAQCGAILYRRHGNEADIVALFELNFGSELRGRAERILLDHDLLHEYLLRGNG